MYKESIDDANCGVQKRVQPAKMPRIARWFPKQCVTTRHFQGWRCGQEQAKSGGWRKTEAALEREETSYKSRNSVTAAVNGSLLSIIYF
jgi:hypothetical protein